MARLTRLLISSTLVLGTLAGASPAATTSLADTADPLTSGSAAPQAAVVLALINAERIRADMAELSESPQLAMAAQLQAEQMRAARHMGHVLPKAPYPQPADRLAAVRYKWKAYAENVAWGQRSEAEVVAAWMDSSGHRANILNRAYTEVGFGAALDAGGRPYYAQVFARPAR